MGMGGGNIGRSVVIMTTMMILAGGGDATTYFVGGKFNGWAENVSQWGEERNFKLGDKLVFEYERGTQNVMYLYDEEDYYYACVKSNDVVYSSGLDTVTLSGGMNLFISGLPGKCKKGDAGVKVRAFALD